MTNNNQLTNNYSNNESESLLLHNLYIERQLIINQIRIEESKSTEIPYFDDAKINSQKKHLAEINEKINYLENILISKLPNNSYRNVMLNTTHGENMNHSTKSREKKHGNNLSRKYILSHNGYNRNSGNTYYTQLGNNKSCVLKQSLTTLGVSKQKSTTEYNNEEGMTL